MDMKLILQSAVDGILMGGIYGLVAIGLTLIFGVMKIINFAQGSLMMIGMYVTFWSFEKLGLNPYLSIPLSAICLFVIGVGIQKFILERTIGAPEHNQLLVTMGIMMVVENAAMALWSPDPRTISIPSLQESLHLGELLINKPRGIAFLVTIVLTVLLYWFLHKTILGKAIRATSISRDGSSIVGIQVKRINYITFGIGAALAAVAGTLITPFFYTSPVAGSSFVLKAFIVVVLGGLGNFVGALIGGLLIGVSEALGGVFLEGSWKELVTFALFILVLLFRPTGLFGRGGK
ncbi:branched-chain amino acid ABC transporter permease [Paenibacillus chartarius]|uniref:Branched-chain amino acid ABC transporter permease n=1 Tax=Paenibacillus chartarius TaxID=747481 RepID=A0ABV6DHZ4_9BACL